MSRASVWTAVAVIALAVAGCADDIGNNAVQPDTITVDPTTLALAFGETRNIAATFSADGAVVTGVASSWTTSNRNVVAINAHAAGAAIIGVGAGAADVTVSAGTASATVHVTVAAGTASQLVIAPTAIAVPLGGVVPIHVAATFPGGGETEVTDQVTWTSDASAIATATGSQVTGVAKGTAHLTATFQGQTASVPVTVGDPVPHTLTLTLVPAAQTFTVAIGATVQFKATQKLTDGTESDVTAIASWTSATPTIATIDNATNKGLATGVAAGSSVITAAIGSLTTNVTLKVTP